MDRWQRALNVQLPGDIRILSVEQVRVIFMQDTRLGRRIVIFGV